MNKRHDHIDDLIASYLAGEANAEEIALVEGWRNQSEENRRYFDQLKIIYDKSAATTTTEHFDTDLAWQKMRQKLEATRTIPLHPAPRRNVYPYLRIAAGVILLVVAGIFTYQFFSSGSRHMEVVADARTVADTLPDGSSVFLNRQSTVAYSFDRKTNAHIAKVTGEAYFDIHHDDDKDFIVEADGTFIKDIGTSFNVKAYPGSQTIEVVVDEGAVMFYTKADSGVFIEANGKGVYNKSTGRFEVAVPEANVTAYKTKSFNFNNHSLEHVATTLNGVYTGRIEIGDNLKNCKLTVSFNNEDMDEIAHVIAETLGLTVEKTGDTIKLKGSGCGNTQP